MVQQGKLNAYATTLMGRPIMNNSATSVTGITATRCNKTTAYNNRQEQSTAMPKMCGGMWWLWQWFRR